jgi:hypothetical protein
LAKWKNKPNSNPNKPNLKKAQMNVNLTLTKDYRKKDDFSVRINIPNSNPSSVKPNISANVFVRKDYENETSFRLQKNKPKQSQFPKGQNEIKIACRKIWPHPMLLTAEKFLALTAEVEHNSSKRDSGCSWK